MQKKRLDEQGLLYLLSKLLLMFVRSEPGKGLSRNDLTDELKAMILAQFSGSWTDLTDRPTNISAWNNDVNFQTALQVSQAISAALTASGFQTAGQVEALIEAALANIDTELFVVVETLPPAATANPNKIYLAPAPGGGMLEEWVAVDGAWNKLGSVDISLEGYFHEGNLVPISNSEIDAMISSLT